MKKFFPVVLSIIILTQSCGSKKHFNLFPISQDKQLGANVAHEFDSTNHRIILDSVQYKNVYRYVYSLRDTLLNTGLITHAKDFAWRIRVIKDDSIQNAFCTPGGYIYVYTGLMKYLESEDQLAGVMGHEMAHAEKRHSTDAMTKQLGEELILTLIFGQDKGQLARAAANIAMLTYSRADETEADLCSVEWLYHTSYNAIGAAGFFEKIEKLGGGSSIPEFLSTHPNPENRITAMKKKWTDLGGKQGKTYAARYKTFQSWLPK